VPVCIYLLHHRQFRKAAGAIPVQHDYTVMPINKQARLQWLFNNNMKCDEYITWSACLAGDISTLNAC
jgi:hypothetical protein